MTLPHSSSFIKENPSCNSRLQIDAIQTRAKISEHRATGCPLELSNQISPVDQHRPRRCLNLWRQTQPQISLRGTKILGAKLSIFVGLGQEWNELQALLYER
jgi:hypothetical protein